MQQFVNIDQEYTVFCLFGGMGGGALGAQMASAEYRGLRGRAVIIGSVDSDPDACADFEMLTGVKATQLDLFDRQQYIDWWGVEPPADWREATPEDLRAAAQGQDPDVVIITAPCKGFSGLLSQERSSSRKYQALNKLTFRGVFLTLEAWRHNLPAFILFENVPRIATRGKRFLREIKGLLAAYGYVFDERHHDCGELGGLAQRRRRYLLVARNPAKVSSYLYHPPRQRVRAIGEVLSELPLPDDPAGGPMHRLPRLQWLTWVRLALIPAGGDWRALQGIEAGKYSIVPESNGLHTNKYRVLRWDGPAGTATGSDRLGSGAPAVADPRLGYQPHRGAYRVGRWDEPSTTVVGSADVRGSNGMAAVADPRIGHTPRDGAMQVGAWDAPAGPVVGSAAVTSSNGMAAVADPRYSRQPRAGVLSVQAWDRPGLTVTGGRDPNGNMLSVADPRLGCSPRNGAYAVTHWDQPAGAVTGAGDVHAQGASCVADPRIPADDERPDPPPVIIAEDGTWHRPLTTLELMALQGFPTRRPDGRPIELAGRSDRAWRERIGNAVPPPTMQAIMEQIIYSLLASETGDFRLDALQTGVWVEPWAPHEERMGAS